MTNEYNVVGEHKTKEHHLLVVGDDGRHYDYALDRDEVSPVEPDDAWRLDGADDGATETSDAAVDTGDAARQEP
jgi:hypothetical protein